MTANVNAVNGHFRHLTVGPLVASHYTAPPTVADVEALEEAYLAAIKQHRLICALLLIEGDTGRVPEQPKARLAELLRRVDGALLGTAIVIRMDGIQGTIVRAFVSAVNLLAHTRAPSRVFASLDDATRWLAALPGQAEAIQSHLADATAVLTEPARAA